MSSSKIGVMSVLIALLIPAGVCNADIASLFNYTGTETNEIHYNDYEVLLHPDAAGTVIINGHTYDEVTDPTLLVQGDLAVQILQADGSVHWLKGPDIYNQTSVDQTKTYNFSTSQLTAFAIEQVAANPTIVGGNESVSFQAASANPFIGSCVPFPRVLRWAFSSTMRQRPSRPTEGWGQTRVANSLTT